MRRKPDPPFRQQQARTVAHLSVQPGIGARRLGPAALVQPAEDQQIGAHHPRLERAPDHDAGETGVAVAHLFPLQQRRQQIGKIAGRHRAAVTGLALQRLDHLQRLLAGVLLPERAGALRRAAGGDPFGQGAQIGDPIGQRPRPGTRPVEETVHDPVEPACQRRIIPARGKAGQPLGVGKGRAVAAQVQLQVAGVAQVVAPSGPVVAQRMFQQRQQCLAGQPRGEQLGHVAQEPARRRQVQRLTGAVVGGDPPAFQRRRDLPRQHPVGRDQRRRLPGFRRLAQAQGDGQRFVPRAGGLDQREVGCGPVQPGQPRPLGHPGVGHGCGPQGERDQPVALGRGRRGLGPAPDAGGRNLQRVHQLAKAVLRMVLGGQRALQPVPHRRGLVEIKAGQHHRALRQPCHRLHQHQRGAPRPGGPGQDHRVLRRCRLPTGDQPLDHPALASLRVKLVLVIADQVVGDADEGLRPRPVAR